MSYTGTTNISLAKAVVQNLIHEDINTLKSDEVLNMTLLDKVLSGSTDIATNATIVNTAGNRFVNLNMITNLSIASITGYIKGCPFTLIQVAPTTNASYIGLSTGATAFKLAKNWNPVDTTATVANKQSITLVWDGTNFVELCRREG